MRIPHGRTFTLPVVALLAASGCTLTNRQTLDKLNYQVRSQQHVIAGQARQIESLTSENTDLKEKLAETSKQFEDQAVLLKVYQDKLASAESAKDQTLAELDELKRIKSKLEQLARENPDSFHWDAKTGTFGVAAEVLFRPGKADLLPSGVKALSQVGAALEGGDEVIRIDGHTDSDPIKFSKWEDNWQLSSERARHVLMFLEKNGIQKDRLFFAGFADTRPRAANDSSEGKRTNRRVELVPMPRQAAALPARSLSMSPKKD